MMQKKGLSQKDKTSQKEANKKIKNAVKSTS
jgi:hypothetical protein